jgi:hypothetical protein
MVKLQMNPTLGPVKIDDGAQINVDGGAARGAGVAGGGGTVLVFTKDGDITMAGKISAHGGKGFDAGTTGGLGGRVYFFSDDNHNALTSNLGNLLVDETGVVDTSGGDGGAMGGNARSDGKAGLVPTFPEHEDQIAIFLNNDGVHGNTLNWLSNRGKLVAHGGAPNGNGGDIVFHGASLTGNTAGGMNGNGTINYSPPSGDIDIAGNGTGQNGDYRGE